MIFRNPGKSAMKRKTDGQAKADEILLKEIEEWKNKYLRALADYQNLEKRIHRERAEDGKSAAKNIILKLLPILDDLEKAQSQLKNEGLALIINKLLDLLKSEEVSKLDVVGKKFDPNCMECIEVKNEGDEVIEEVRSGYLINNNLLRAAQVNVGKKG